MIPLARSCFWICLMLSPLEFLSSSESLIRAKNIQQNRITFHLSSKLTQKYVRHPLRLSYPLDMDLAKLPPSIVDIPLITNVIAVIWLSGQEYTIEEMDEDLYYSLIKVKSFFKRFFYNTSWEGELKPKKLVKNTIPPLTSRPPVLFTGGLDSTTTVFQHLTENPILLSFKEPHQRVTEFVKTHHLDFYLIEMNYESFLKLTVLDKASCDIDRWFWDANMALSWIGAAAPYLYAQGIPELYISSGFHWKSFLFPDGQTLNKPASPLIDENLSPAGLRVHHAGFFMTRTDKIKFVSDFCKENSLEKPQLVVCNYHRKNDTSHSPCHHCGKCRITMLDIIAIGEQLQDYGFTLSEEEFMEQFQHYLLNLKMSRGGTYAALYDTQQYIQRHFEELPQTYQQFYLWFTSLDLYAMTQPSTKRPLRAVPFCWKDYQDLYPGVEHFVDGPLISKEVQCAP